MNIIITVMSILLVLLLSFLIYRAIKGYLVASRLNEFENKYDELLLKTNSKEISLMGSIQNLKSGPIFNKLSDADTEKVVSILKEALDPKKVIKTIVLRMDSQKS